MSTADEAGQHIAKSSDLIQGTLEMLILKTLALEPMHGYGVALRIEQISKGVFRVNPGSLLPALSRMERAGRAKSEWRLQRTIAAPSITC
jgi:PadR family transcriptional regulator